MEKSSAFEKLKTDDPATAGFLQDIAAVFGKPCAVAIRFKDGERYDGGRFMAAQDYPDFLARLPKPLYLRQRKGKRR
jgi:hypothetical protein